MGLLKELGIGKYLKKVKDYTDEKIENLIGTAPETLDTIHELATAIKENETIIDALNGAITNKADKSTVENVINNSISKVINITYSELVSLRNSSKLIAGQKYRITDYDTTTAQVNTTSAYHPFDVIVTALDNCTLSENASAIRSDRDGDNYFETENLEAWQLKYCLDNDTERFAWADNHIPNWYSKIIANYIVDQGGKHEYSLDKEHYIYDFGSMSHPDTGEETLVFYTQDPMYFEETGADYTDIYFYNGITTVDGVQYDSWKKYDDENKCWVNLESNGSDEEGLYALTERVVFDGEFVWPDLSEENGKGVIYNMIDEYGNECPYDFKNIKFYHDGLGTDVYTFTWIDDSYNAMDASVFGNNGTLTYYGEIYGVYGNVIKPYIERIYDEDSGDYLGTKHYLNNITFISDYEYETAGNEGFYGCHSNSFGNDCRNNFFGNICYGNSFGNNCYNNSFVNDCHDNSFGDDCYDNSFGDGCCNNSFGNSCYNNSFGNSCVGNSFGNSCVGNSFGNSCVGNSFGNICYNNSFGSYCYDNSFGNGCYDNSFRLRESKTAALLTYCYHNHFDDGCSYNVIWNNVQPTYSTKLQNINIVRGVYGTYSTYNFINVVDKNANYEIKVAKNSSGEIKIYCEADLIK